MVMSRRNQSPRVIALLVVGLVLLIAGIWLGGHPSWMPASLRNAFTDTSNGQLVNEELNLIEQQYYRPVKRNQLLNQGLAGMVASLQDPYSHYYSPSEYRSFLDQDNPHLNGIGVDVLPNPRGLQVVDVFQGSPAARAGLTHGDLIVKVGTTSLSGRSSTFASNLIKGPPGTEVVLTVVRGRSTRVVRIRRAALAVPVASESLVTYHGVKIGDVQLTAFTDGSGAEVRQKVQAALNQHAQALILDLRENGGGLLTEAVNVASIFIPNGTIVSTAGRAQARQVYLATGNAIAAKIPMVVLVDQDTASAAEIVTGALKDRGRAKVVGTHTYGKGVFQEIQPLSNGGALDMTVGEYFTPNGQNLGGADGAASAKEVQEGPGIQPNVYAPDPTDSTVDSQLQTAERVVAAEVR
jgi:carboxyl-terminal processing protease